MNWAWYCSLVRMEASGVVLGIVCGSITGSTEISTKQNTLINPRWRDLKKKTSGCLIFDQKVIKGESNLVIFFSHSAYES